MRLLTYNIHKGFSVGNRRFTLETIRHALHQIDAEIVFLQEVRGHSDHHPLPPDGLSNRETEEEAQFEYLADQLWPHHAYGKNAIYRSGHHGNAILSSHPFSEWENINVSTRRYASRSLLHGVIEPTPGIPLHLICVHLGLFEGERRIQLTRLVERIRSHVPDHEALVIAGDFNDWRRQANEYLCGELGLVDIYASQHGKPAQTYPVWRPLLAVDRIYARGITEIDCHRLHGKPWTGLSDHLPLTAKFSLEPPCP
jgi:endonuclease/exonuclease/phosphatase family metal-dependent hydrolase